jgi:hypothetical protein
MTFIKAKLLLLSVALVWLFFIIVMAPLIVPVTIAAIWFRQLRPYRYKLWIAQDQIVNAIHNGNPDETISSRVGYMAKNGSKTAKKMAIVIDFIFYIAIGQRNHCAVCIEWDEIK